MVPFYEALRQMNEEGKFFCRNIVDTSLDRGSLHIGVLKHLNCFIAVMCDKNNRVGEMQTVHAWGDVDDLFAHDWTYSAINNLADYDFPQEEMNTYDQLEYDVWPSVFEQVGNKVHPGWFKSTVRHLFWRRVYSATKFDHEQATCPVMNVEDLESKIVEWCNILITRLTNAGKNEGISFITDAALYLVPGGFQIRLHYYAKETDIKHVMFVPMIEGA